MNNIKVCVIGLGYVGLPLALEFCKHYQVVGFDIKTERVAELQSGTDSTLEVTSQELSAAQNISFTSNVEEIKGSNFYIVTVPTPVNQNNLPDLSPLKSASTLLGDVIVKGDVVVYESTVYPGATEEECIPILEEVSGLKLNTDFGVGYSPERINPGDKSRTVANILKITSGSNEHYTDLVDNVYRNIIIAGTHKATSIKVAEAAKVIENVQRDVNIALINELHQIFSNMNIKTEDVIEAAATKWNFMKLLPGLVGGHCIGVDPYYLMHKAQTVGFVPDLIRTSREINGGMPAFLANDFLRKVVKAGTNPVGLNVLIYGFTFKENCPDVRNTKIIDMVHQLEGIGFQVRVYDPWADKNEVKTVYNIEVEENLAAIDFEAVFIAVGHEQLADDKSYFKEKLVYDFKGLLKS